MMGLFRVHFLVRVDYNKQYDENIFWSDIKLKIKCLLLRDK